MEQASEIDWKTILWIAGGIFTFFFGIVSGLLAWIGIMQKETKKIAFDKNLEQDHRLSNHDIKFEEHQGEIHELALQNRETLTIIKHKLKMK